MGSLIIVLASQALALAAPPAELPAARGVRVSAVATVQILHAETTLEDTGPQALKRQRLTSADGRVAVAFE